MLRNQQLLQQFNNQQTWAVLKSSFVLNMSYDFIMFEFKLFKHKTSV